MATESGHLSLNDGQKSRLLGVALAADKPVPAPDENEQRGDLLCDLLRCSLPAPEAASVTGGTATRSSHGGLRSVFGPSIREVLLNPKTDVATLQKIKDYAKTLGQDAGSEVEKDIFLALYFAAIAAAMAFHREHITEHTDADLAQFFAYYVSAEWVPGGLRELFERVVCHGSETRQTEV